MDVRAEQMLLLALRAGDACACSLLHFTPSGYNLFIANSMTLNANGLLLPSPRAAEVEVSDGGCNKRKQNQKQRVARAEPLGNVLTGYNVCCKRMKLVEGNIVNSFPFVFTFYFSYRYNWLSVCFYKQNAKHIYSWVSSSRAHPIITLSHVLLLRLLLLLLSLRSELSK